MAGAVCRSTGFLATAAANRLGSAMRAPLSAFPSLHAAATPAEVEAKKERKMSSAMRLYLQRKREHDMFIAREQAEFDIGKQHLANMMGMDHNTMTQEDIDQSIEYLFPSGLDKEARPMMKPPEFIFPRQKEAEFDAQGRPYQPFFYTLTPDFHNRIFSLRDGMQAVTIFGDRLRSQGKRPDPEQVLDVGKLADSRWVTRDELSAMTLEKISENEYNEFINVLDRLCAMPFSYRLRDEIFSYRVAEGTAADLESYITPQYDEQGRAFVEYEGQRKTAHAKVRVTKPGKGLVTIRHEEHPHYVMDIGYFYALKERLAVLYPLQVTKMLGLVDLDVRVRGGGSSAQAGAIRYAMSMCLRSFVEKSVVNTMKISGLLTQDIRVGERKKYGRVKARKGYTWKRR